jgi:hypothetical protein
MHSLIVLDFTSLAANVGLTELSTYTVLKQHLPEKLVSCNYMLSIM